MFPILKPSELVDWVRRCGDDAKLTVIIVKESIYLHNTANNEMYLLQEDTDKTQKIEEPKELRLAALYPKYNCPICSDWFHMPYKFCKCDAWKNK